MGVTIEYYTKSDVSLDEVRAIVAAAEMAFAGGVGAELQLDLVPHDLSGADDAARAAVLLFSESNTRFLCEVPADKTREFDQALAAVPHARLGETTETLRLRVRADSRQPLLIDADLHNLKEAWQAPLRW